MSIIELNNVEVRFKRKKQPDLVAVSQANLQVEQGEIFGIVGFSGAGKSTLVRTINLLQVPTSGSVTVAGQEFVKDGKQVIAAKKLQASRRKIGMIFQQFNLLDETTVLENVAFALRHSGLSNAQIEAKCHDLLKLVGLDDKAEQFPASLSGGQKQRVAIARALANDPEILLSDEATSALDPQNTLQILDLLKDLNQKLGLTIVLITHEMDVIKRIASKVAVMESGKIIEQGPLQDIFLTPKEDLTKNFVGGSSDAIQTLHSLNLTNLAADEHLYQLVYNLQNVTESVIIELYRQIGVETSMLYGNVELLAGVPVGTLVVRINGTAEQQIQASEFLAAKGVKATRLDQRGQTL